MRRVTATQIGPLKIVKEGKTTYESGPQIMARILSDQYQVSSLHLNMDHVSYKN